jgi:hypothetical protein
VAVDFVRTWARVFCLVVCLIVASCLASTEAQAFASGITSTPPVIVIGFVGGFIRHDDIVHSGVQVAARIRKDYPSGVYVQVYENRRVEQAHAQILKLLDTNHDGSLSRDEKQNARIVIYGHSWGGSETVALARELQRDGIPVLLTIQVDSIAKLGEDDAVIPANVAEAANFYQANGLVRGRAHIRAADPRRTQILGNFQFDYATKPIRCAGYPWYAVALESSHIAIECDPTVIRDVETLIRSKLP